MSAFGDLRLRDWRECGHHPVFPTRAWACLERLEGPIPQAVEHPTSFDELTEEGWGQWVYVHLLPPEGLDVLHESIHKWNTS